MVKFFNIIRSVFFSVHTVHILPTETIKLGCFTKSMDTKCMNFISSYITDLLQSNSHNTSLNVKSIEFRKNEEDIYCLG